MKKRFFITAACLTVNEVILVKTAEKQSMKSSDLITRTLILTRPSTSAAPRKLITENSNLRSNSVTFDCCQRTALVSFARGSDL